ncbi:hypothetical protein RIF29_11049 [Crotalaria pallida]|uniref:Uncharacterized protein n=1 Tax=Crotalaria pallida TaxID=3830 RepID=A0AAN9FTJ0_CROPI
MHIMVLRRKRPLTLLFCFFVIIFLCLLGHCHGSRTTNAFKFKPNSQHSGHFFGFLPRGIPTPYSSPSRKHNDIGLSWRSSP